jgi:hypothetical protein
MKIQLSKFCPVLSDCKLNTGATTLSTMVATLSITVKTVVILSVVSFFKLLCTPKHPVYTKTEKVVLM